MQQAAGMRARAASSMSEKLATTAQSPGQIQPKSIREYSHDIHLLDEWIDEVLNKSSHSYANADASMLLRFLQQYNVCFEELVRHTSALSPALARSMEKVWAGAYTISENCLKARRDRPQVAQKLQVDAQDMLSRGANVSLAAKGTCVCMCARGFGHVFGRNHTYERVCEYGTVQQDEFALQAAAYRARTRVLEAELEALREQYAAAEKDNQQLRSIVYRHIYATDYKSADAQHPGQLQAGSQQQMSVHTPEAGTLAMLRERGVALRQSLNDQQEQLQLLVQVRLLVAIILHVAHMCLTYVWLCRKPRTKQTDRHICSRSWKP